MRERALYSCCLIDGQGELQKCDGTIIPFLIKNVSAIDAEIILKQEMQLDEIYIMRISFSASLREVNMTIKGRLSKLKFEEDPYAYIVTFVGVSEEQKIELDEILMKSFILLEDDSPIKYFAHR